MGDRLFLVPACRPAEWQEAFAGVAHDFYHSAAYHLFSEQQGEGRAFLAVYRERGRSLLWPYLLRPITGLGADGLNDVTSVYGYPGPVGVGCEGETEFLRRAYSAVLNLWLSQRVVAAFSRLHTVLENHRWLPPEAPPTRCGQTVSIDLEQASERIWSGYRKSLRHEIRKARRNGVWVEFDDAWQELDTFVSLYRQTMRRNRASACYLFDAAYFRRLLERLCPRAQLVLVRWEDRVIGGGIFVEWKGIVQNHFCASDPAFLHLSPTKVLLDAVRSQSQQERHKVFHLGGGRGAQYDSLFQFKAAFSKRRHDFYVWKAVVDPVVYRELCAVRQAGDAGEDLNPGYFPAYRGN